MIVATTTVDMKVKRALVLVICTLTLVSSQEVAHSRRGSTVLQQAIKNLINYTATEAEARLDKNNIGSIIAAIAYQELTAKLGRCMSSL